MLCGYAASARLCELESYSFHLIPWALKLNAHRVSEALLVPILAQNRLTMVTGRFVASSPDFLQKAAA
jgi:hypothetical protein